MKEFQGRAIIPGNCQGNVLVTHSALNVLATYIRSLNEGLNPAICSDHNNKELYGKALTGQIICIPQVIGSTMAGLVIQAVAAAGTEPKAILLSRTADSLAVAGVLLADIWENKQIITVDGLGDEFLNTVREGDYIEITPDGTVRICN